MSPTSPPCGSGWAGADRERLSRVLLRAGPGPSSVLAPFSTTTHSSRRRRSYHFFDLPSHRGFAAALECLHDVRLVRASAESRASPVIHRGARELGNSSLRIPAAGSGKPDWLY